MTHEELIKNTNDNKAAIAILQKEIKGIEKKNTDILADYTAEHRKFQDGEIVHYTEEKYKTPREYIVKSVRSFIEHHNDDRYNCKIMYNIATKNGHKPNGGWLIDEKFLVKA